MTDKEQSNIQQGASGGKVATSVGARAEEHNLDQDDPQLERATAKDNPEMDEQKGDKAMEKIKKGDQAR